MIARIVPRRRIVGMSAILLPFAAPAEVDWPAFEAHVTRTSDAGLTPAVNMDTGYVQLLDDATRIEVLDRTTALVGGAFVAGAFVADGPGAPLELDRYRRAMGAIEERGGTPVVFPSHGLNELPDPALIDALATLGTDVDRFIAFELGPMFVPYGRIYGLDAYRALLDVPSCIGAKHSSLDRGPELDRLALRDEVRPDFHVFTGNDLAIDMVVYGSDYLLGLSTFAPDLFARRDALWLAGDPAFYELNDKLQYLGHLAFRDPVPGYRHDAAMFLHLRGWTQTDLVPDGVPRRPDADRDLLRALAIDLGLL